MSGPIDSENEAGRAGAAGDRGGGLPLQAVAGLRASGALLIDPEASLAATLEPVRVLARSDGAAAAILASHIAAALLRAWTGLVTPAGSLLSLAGGEVRGVTDDQRWRLQGTAVSEAGAGVADTIAIVFKDAGPRAYAAFLDVGLSGLAIEASPERIGLRQAAGGILRLEGVVPAAGASAALPLLALERLALLEQATRIALLVGTAEGALAEGRLYTLHKSRPWVYSPYEKHIDDPFVQRRYGELHIRARAAVVLADAAYGRLDAALRSDAAAPPDIEAALDAAELWAGHVALAAGSGVFEVMGARSATQENGYDRFWRNARTITLHHAAADRAVALADWLLDGAGARSGAEARR